MWQIYSEALLHEVYLVHILIKYEPETAETDVFIIRQLKKKSVQI